MRFTVNGAPQPAGSKRGFVSKTGRVIITDDAKNSRPWKALVADAAAQAMGDGADLYHGPLRVFIEFYFVRPKSHFGTGRNAMKLKPSAPRWPAVKPDVDKLSRAVMDACTGIVWRDDAQVVQKVVEKRYASWSRAEVTVEMATDLGLFPIEKLDSRRI